MRFRGFTASRGRLLVVALAASLLMALAAQSPHLWDRYHVEGDVQNSYWMARFQDPELFSRDYMLGGRLIEVDVLGAHLILYPRSLGYGLLFYLASFVIDHIWLSKLLIFLLMPVCVFYLYSLGNRLADRWTALSLSLMFAFFALAFPRSISIATGLQRAFSVPLLIACLYYLATERYVGAGLTVFASALFYLPMLPLTALTCALSLVRVERPLRPALKTDRRVLVPLIAGVVLSVPVIVLAMALEFGWVPFPTAPGAMIEPGQSRPSSEEFFHHSQGYAPLFSGSVLVGRAGLFDMGGELIIFCSLLLLGLFVYMTVGRRSFKRMPTAVWSLLLASFILYAVSLFAILRFSSMALYYPSRYTRASLFLAAFLFVGLNWSDVLHKAPNHFGRNALLLFVLASSLGMLFSITYLLSPTQPLALAILLLVCLPLSGALTVLGGSSLVWLLRRQAPGSTREDGLPVRAVRVIAVLVAGIITVALGSVYIGTLSLAPGRGMTDPPDSWRDVYEFVSTLPKDAMIAGDPEVMDGIPLFSERSVLLMEMQPGLGVPILPFFDAYYSESPQAVVTFCQEYDVDFFVVNREHFSTDYLAQENFFYDPYNETIAQAVALRSNFVLPQVPVEHWLFQTGDLFVIPCSADVFK